ncbi:hypothetical protein [Streptomyces sp. L7]|uniref:hypothetical protein n=1 Tax=Streptomyces sp. L7 TaxID=3423954 RepID=UPI003D95CB22
MSVRSPVGSDSSSDAADGAVVVCGEAARTGVAADPGSTDIGCVTGSGLDWSGACRKRSNDAASALGSAAGRFGALKRRLSKLPPDETPGSANAEAGMAGACSSTEE